MPNVERSRHWFVRVTRPHSFCAEKYKLLRQWIDYESSLCLTHVGDKTEKEHIHFCVTLKTELQKQSFDTRVKKLFEVKGSDFSSKVWDGLAACLGYMFHDQSYTIICSDGHTTEDIEKYKDLNKKVQEVVAINKERGAKRVVERVVAEYKGAGRPSKLRITFRLLQMIKDGEMYEPGDFVLKRYVEEIYIKLIDNEEDWERYCNLRFQNIFRE